MELPARCASGQVWRECPRRSASSGLTIEAFCQRERDSIPSCYPRRRKPGGSAGVGTSRVAREARKNWRAWQPVSGPPRVAMAYGSRRTLG